jgi:hypothetical protein
MMWDNDLYTKGKKWITTKMITSIHLNSNGNEIIACCSLDIWSNLFLSNHHRCMYCHQCSLNRFYVSQVSNDNFHQNLKTVFDNNNMHSSLNMTREKVGDLPLNMHSIFQSNSCNNILKCVVGYYYMLTTTKAPKQMGTSPTFFFSQWANLIGPLPKKNWNYEGSPKLNFFMGTWSASPVGPPM